MSCCSVIISKYRKLVVDYKNINNKEKSTQNKTKKKEKPQMFLGITEGNMALKWLNHIPLSRLSFRFSILWITLDAVIIEMPFESE